MNIVLITNNRIFPPVSGGHLRTANIAKSLANAGIHTVVLSMTGRRSDYRLTLARSQRVLLNPVGSHLTEIVDLHPIRAIWQGVFRRLNLARVWQYYGLSYSSMRVEFLAELQRADLVICDFPFFSFAGKKYKPGQRWVLLSHNLEHQIYRQMSSWFYRSLVAKIIERIERSASDRYDAILLCGEDEHKFFASQASTRLTSLGLLQIPNGVERFQTTMTADQRRALRQKLGISDDQHVLLFTGSRYQPNIEAVSYLKNLVTTEAALLKTLRVHFLVVGTVESDEIRGELFSATGFVEEVRPYFEIANAMINPVLLGSGSNVKIFEAIAAGLPLISTDFGARGLGLQAGRDYIPLLRERFAADLPKIIAQSRHWAELGQAVQKRWSRQVVMDDIVSDRVLPMLSRLSERN